MSAVEASSVRVQTMADGTLRIVCDIEPRFAQDAFALFGRPGTPMALAALKNAAQRDPEPSTAPSEEMKGGPLSKWVAMRCNEPDFWRWLNVAFESADVVTNADDAADLVRDLCGVDSRREIDHKPEAARYFHEAIRGPYQKHCIARGITT